MPYNGNATQTNGNGKVSDIFIHKQINSITNISIINNAL